MADLTRSDVQAILTEGAYYLIDDYAQRDELLPKLADTFLTGIEKLAGGECRERVAADGLGRLHRHFPVAKIRLLEAYLLRRLRDDLYYWSYRVGADTLGLRHPFYVDHLVVFRIHYPFLAARRAEGVEAPPYDWGERLRLLGAALRDWGMLKHYLGKRGSQGHDHGGFDPDAYHRGLPGPARAHGPHVDTWYGHSYDGINLWLSVDGVNPDNTIILYPELFHRPVAYDPGSMYLAPGVPVTRPHRVAPAPGQLLVFNPETLHGTQLNVSDETRIALTTRINPGEPRFAHDAPFHMEHWYASPDLERRRFVARVFPADQYRGERSVREVEPYEDERTVRVRKEARPESNVPYAVCRSDELRPGDKMAADLGDLRVLLWRDGDEVRAFSRVCPHLGIDLGDGYHDGDQISCPGHGIAYSWSDGRSKCDAFALQRYEAFEADGQVYLEARPGAV